MASHSMTSGNVPKDRMGRILAAAAAAPSSHNTQPWRFHLDAAAGIVEVWGDEQRMLPRSDADHRQFFLSLGCAAANIVAAAFAEGLIPEVAILPDAQEPFCAARISLGVEEGPHPAGTTSLADAIRTRHANRNPYKQDKLSPGTLSFINSLASPDATVMIIEDDVQKTEIARIVADATEAAFYDKGFTEELSRWIKPSLKRYRDGMPGYNIGVPWPLSFIVPLAIRHGNVAKQQRKMVEGPLKATPAYVVIATKENDPRAWITVGMLLERIWLEATRTGLAMGPLAAAIQIGEFYKELQTALGTSLRPQVFARLGYPTKVPPPSPRRDPASMTF